MHYLIAALFFSVTTARALTVEEWLTPEPFVLEGPAPQVWLGDDPVLGRSICPAILRTHLASQKVEPLLVREPEAPSPLLWRYYIKEGLHWWSGDLLTAGDFARFMEERLTSIVKSKGLWAVPSHKVSLKGSAIEIAWASAPEFGPYVLSGSPLWREVKSTKAAGLKAYECVGLYRPQIVGKGSSQILALEPTPGYSQARTPWSLLLNQAGGPQRASDSAKIKLAFAEGTDPDPFRRRGPNQPQSCAVRVPLPMMSVVRWNLAHPLMASPEVRAAMTEMIPRGNLLRAGSAHWGELSSSLIPRMHPGYHRASLVRAYNPRRGMGVLKGKGVFQKLQETGGLKLRSARDSWGVVEKVVTDSFRAVGLNVELVKHTGERGIPSGVHGEIVGVFLPWPELNFIKDFHSRLSLEGALLKSPKLDQDLEAYAKSLSLGSPDFASLENIHKTLYALEPVSVLLSHDACLSVESSRTPLGRVSVLDPDWFRAILSAF